MKEVYGAYTQWCHEQRKDPENLTRFGTTMKGELNTTYEERAKRSFYLNIALAGSPRLVAVNA